MTANERMSAAWNGGEAVHYVDHAERYDRQLAPFADALLERVALRSDHTVLDIGCGCGVTTLAAAAVARSAVGLDISVPLLEIAARRADEAELRNATFLLADAQTHPFEPATFDVVLSQFGLMFFDDPVAAFTNIRRSMAPGALLAFVSWNDLIANEWVSLVARAVSPHAEVPDLGGLDGGPGMFALKRPDDITALLHDAGYAHVAIEPITTDITVGGGGTLDESADFFLGMGIVRGLLGRVDGEAHAVAVATVRASLAERYRPGHGVTLGASGWMVTGRQVTAEPT